MVFVACGLNHKTAPIKVREKIALPTSMHDSLLYSLLSIPQVNEAAILSTCNRTEIYCDTNDPDVLPQWLANNHQLEQEQLSSFFYLYEGHQGIKHTLRVASGLDSMMLGEPQILGQMKQAYQQACRLGTIKTQLRPVFEYIFKASKRIRNQSGIGKNPISVAYAAVQLINELFPRDSSLTVFLIGSGETATLVAKYLQQQERHQFMVASRTRAHAQKLAHPLVGIPLSITEIPHYLAHADVVISATACPLPFIDKALVQHAMAQRKQAPMFFLDLAVPRDIESDVAELPGVHLYNIDDLEEVTIKGFAQRQQAANQAEELINYELNNYIRWHRSQKANHMICEYRNKMDELAQHELQRAFKKILAGQNQEQVLHELANRLVNKLVHQPTEGLKMIAADNQEELLALTQYFFNITNSKSNYEEIA